MGKGDRKTAKGKRFNSSYGNVRPKALAKLVTPASPAAPRATAAAAKKPAAARSAGTAKKVVRKTAA